MGSKACEENPSLVQFGWKLRRARPDVILSFTLYPNVACGLT